MIQPLHDNLLVKPLAEENVSAKGIVLSTKKEDENSVRGEVIALSDGYKVGADKPIQFKVKPGDIVVFKEYSGTTIEYQNIKYKLLSYEDIIAIIK